MRGLNQEIALQRPGDTHWGSHYDSLNSLILLFGSILEVLEILKKKLALILPIATATVKRTFSTMNIIKNPLRNRMGDSWMNDCLLTYIEKDIFNSVDNDLIVQRFKKMKTRREKL
ncbi:hypothetical protein MA16_Dca026094 [Dendrobium catenatum]|uniref:Uncharacterized protein n=1 Tax=Dendrobium catenatum TaxID=906689 RepID=A0A2I0X3Q3_9ASPA|nr:hypothetical protein MA16_Dca026094 [Dendrobium catenatum]